MIVAGTGHRPDKLGGYNNDTYLKLVEIAEEWLIENKPSKVISGMALGWDQALAQAAINCNIPLIAAVPFEGQERMWSDKSKRYFNKLLSMAESVTYVCEEGYAPYKMQVRNEWMVNNSDLILAMWDGTNGGTGNCIKYANKANKTIVNLYEEWNSYVTTKGI
jgi:uncharacterized phage-like protein YoqJ